MPVPVRICGGGTCEFQTMPAHHRHPAGDSLCGLTEGVPERGWRGAHGRSAATREPARSWALCSLIRVCQRAGRHPLQIATATFVPLPRGWWQGRQHQALHVQIGALPAWLWAAWLHVTKTPGRREVMSSLHPFLSPHVASSHCGWPSYAF